MNDDIDHETDITITSDGNGTYTLVIGNETWKSLTLDEVLSIISGKEIDNDGR